MQVIIVWLRGARTLHVYFISVIFKYISITNMLFTKDEKSFTFFFFFFFFPGLINLNNYDDRL